MKRAEMWLSGAGAILTIAGICVLVAAVLTSCGESTSAGFPIDLGVEAKAARAGAPNILDLRATIDGDRLVVRARLDEAARDLGDGWEVQVYVDTDRDDATGAMAGGWERVARVRERDAEGRLPVRVTSGASGDPLAGGWGPIVGFATWDPRGRVLVVDVPIEAIAPVSAAGVDVMFLTDSPSTWDSAFTSAVDGASRDDRSRVRT